MRLAAVFDLMLMLGVAWCLPALPQDTPGPPKEEASHSHCLGPVGWSAVGAGRVHQTKLLSYTKLLYKNDVIFNHETGEATLQCPGVYSINFSAIGSQADTKVALKRNTGRNNWAEVAIAGGWLSGGGSNHVLLNLERGDQIALWLVSGTILPSNDRASTSISFSGFRISK